VVVAFVFHLIDQHQPGRFQNTSILLRAERYGESAGHAVGPLANLSWGGEEKLTAGRQSVSYPVDELFLRLRSEQEEHAPGNHAIELAPEEVGSRHVVALDGHIGESGSERRDHARRCIHAMSLEAGIDEELRDGIARTAAEVQHRASGAQCPDPFSYGARTDGRTIHVRRAADSDELGRDRLVAVGVVAHGTGRPSLLFSYWSFRYSKYPPNVVESKCASIEKCGI
jgi:hypothetical protein